MKNPFHRKSTFEKLVSPVEKAIVPIASAAVSKMRNRQDVE
jgi:hypothetical protein